MFRTCLSSHPWMDGSASWKHDSFALDQDADQRAGSREEEISNPGVRRLLRKRWGPAYRHQVIIT